MFQFRQNQLDNIEFTSPQYRKKKCFNIVSTGLLGQAIYLFIFSLTVSECHIN